jgi:hypothetical protein
MRTMRQLSIFGNRLTSMYFSARAVPIPTTTPMMRLPKKTSRKIPIASKSVMKVRFPAALPSLYRWAVSNSTIAMASLRIDSPNITVYSLGSTLYKLNMARMVTGSVADRVAPTEKASTNVIFRPSSGTLVQSHNMTPRTTAEMKVPAKANVRIVPMLRKKFAYNFVSRNLSFTRDATNLM